MAKAIENETRPLNWESVMIWSGPFATAIDRASEACLEGWREWQREVSRFVGARIEENRRLRQSLGACQNFEDIAKLQQDWSQAAIKSYIEEIGLLPQIAARCFHDGAVKPAEDAVAETARNVRSVQRDAREAAE